MQRRNSKPRNEKNKISLRELFTKERIGVTFYSFAIVYYIILLIEKAMGNFENQFDLASALSKWPGQFLQVIIILLILMRRR